MRATPFLFLAALLWLGCTTDASGLAPDEPDASTDSSTDSLGGETSPPGDTSLDTGADTAVDDTGLPPDTTVPPDTGVPPDTTVPPDTSPPPDTSGDACSAPFALCGAKCVNLTTDNGNCGACGTKCGAGMACGPDGSGKGVCSCTGGKTLCLGTCVDTTLDGNCGGCGVVCDPTFAKYSVCSSSACKCEGTKCGTTCIDTASDAENCGGCGSSFTCYPSRYCSKGSCTCRPGLTDCSTGPCTDLKGDGFHCGGCGTACKNNERCISGSCKADSTACPAGRSVCAGPASTDPDSCFDFKNDQRHCGGCGTSSAVGEVCANAKCQPYAPAVGCTVGPCDARCKLILSTSAGVKFCSYGGANYCVLGPDCPLAIVP